MENTTTFELIIIDYIRTTYKVTRIKSNNRFRRAMILDDGCVYFLKDEPESKKIKFKIADYLKLIFSLDKNYAEKLISIALSI